MKISVFTVMMGKDYMAEAVAEKLAEKGYDGVEWRVHEQFHVSPVDLSARAAAIKALATKNGLEMPALATYIPASDTAQLAEVFSGAAAMGSRMVRVGVPGYNRTRPYHELFHESIDQLRKVERLATERGIKAVIEIHFGTIVPSAALARRLVERFDPQHIGVTFDPGNMAIEGMENWRMSLEILGEYLAHVHVKNAAWYPKAGGGWEWKWVPMRAGMVDWAQVIADLRAIQYDGWLSLEDFSSAPVEEKLSDDIAFLRDLLQS